jgi:hypothetical protein
MSGVGRLLVASLHQGIADLLPDRLEFYEAWLNPIGLRNGRIGLASLAAVLSFLRQEGQPYHLVAARAGEYAADWALADLPRLMRVALRIGPSRLRVRLALRVARRLVRQTCGDSRAIVHPRRSSRAIDIRGSVFCEVRTRMDQPMCGFYGAAVRRLLERCRVEGTVDLHSCRATGGERCVVHVRLGGPAVPA